MALLMPNAEQKQITFKNLIQEEIPVYADVNTVDTVIRKFLSNALKFLNFRETIEASARQNGICVEMSLSNTGIGIRKEDIPKFFRVDVKYKERDLPLLSLKHNSHL
jgi:two-component system sensor histidine kinase/response regulator